MTEREAFEAWCKSKGAPKENWWVRQLDDGGYSCEPVDKAWEAWQAARAQPAQAVPITSETGNQAAQGASGITSQVVPVLTEAELRSILQGTNHMVKNAMHGAFWPELEEACRAVEQAVRAKLGVAVPMTHMQIVMLWGHRSDGPSTPEIVSFARLVERHHGIVGKEGAWPTTSSKPPRPQAQPAQAVPKRCELCNYQHGHQIGCKNSPVGIALEARAAIRAQGAKT